MAITEDQRRQAALLQAAAKKYEFPAPTTADLANPEAYERALIAHVHKRDYAAAHELRIGKVQADWTPAEVDGFERLLRGMPRAAHELDPGVHAFHGLDFGDGFPVTVACLTELASDTLQALVAMRRESPTKQLPIFAVVLLTTGQARLLTPSSDARIAVLKALARTQPVFGFALTFDAFMHQFIAGSQARKVDTIVQHLITRDLRLIKRRPYRLDSARAVFDEPPPEDLDGRVEGPDLDDPYAEIFVLPSTEVSRAQ
jgi:hypothetical protein